MRNQSGKTFENADIKLLAGDVNKIENPGPMGRVYAAAKMAMEADAVAPVVKEKSFDEFHLYTLERPTTLLDQETKQVEFVSAPGIRAQRIYVYDGAKTDMYGYYSQRADSSGRKLWHAIQSQGLGHGGIQKL